MKIGSFFLVFGCLVLFTSSFLANAQEDNDFRVLNNGGVEIQGRTFPNMNDYVSSDIFQNIGGRCAADNVSQRLPAELRNTQAKSQSDCTQVITKIKAEYQPTVIMTIPVWFHVIMHTSGVGAVTNAAINAQIQVLNEDFQALAGTIGQNSINAKLKFILAGVTRTTNDAWYTDSVADEFAYKSALGKDQTKFLNIYTNDASGFLGYAYFPQAAAGSVFDGVVALSESVGGRNNGFVPYDQGRTIVHEIGHYLGLYHTFQGGSACQNTFTTGDLIVDTNAEADPYYGGASCSSSSSSCGNVDPVHNYMDYNFDSCMTEFTNQQVNRMICSAVNYRPGLLTVVDNKGNIVPIYHLLLGG